MKIDLFLHMFEKSLNIKFHENPHIWSLVVPYRQDETDGLFFAILRMRPNQYIYSKILNAFINIFCLPLQKPVWCSRYCD